MNKVQSQLTDGVGRYRLLHTFSFRVLLSTVIAGVIGTVLGTVEGRATNLVFFVASVFFSLDTTAAAVTGKGSFSVGVFLKW